MRRPHVYERSAPRGPREAYQEAKPADRSPVILPAINMRTPLDRFDEGLCGDAKGGNVSLSLLSAMFQGLIARAEAAGQSRGKVAAVAS